MTAWTLPPLVRDAASETLGEGLDRPNWWVPDEIELVQRAVGCISWRQEQGRRVTADRDFLIDFWKLTDGDDETVEAFAKDWGVFQPRTWPATGLEDPYCQPCDLFRDFARKTHLLSEIAGYVFHRGEPAPPECWESFYKDEPITPWEPDTERDALQLREELNAWLREMQVRPLLQVKWSDSATPKCTIDLYGGGLAGAVATQTLFEITRSAALVLCSECGTPYFPERRPNPNRRSYCDSCRQQGAAERFASKAYRRRQRKKGGAS